MRKLFVAALLLWALPVFGQATFTNTEGTGWNSAIQNSTSTAGATVTAPTDMADGFLGLAIMSQDGNQNGNDLVISNVTGEVSEFGVGEAAGSPTLYAGYWEQSGSSAADWELNDSAADNEQEIGVVIAISGYDSGDIIAESVTGSGSSTTSATIPAATVSASSDDLIFYIVAADSDTTISSMPGTLITSEVGGSFNTGLAVSFAAGSGGTPGSESATLSKTTNYVAAIVIVSGAGGGGSSVAPLAQYYNQQRNTQ